MQLKNYFIYKKIKKNKGFFILEALIAVLIFSIGIVGLLKTQTDSIDATSNAQFRGDATYMAKNLISKITIDKDNINSYVSGSHVNYQTWLTELEQTLPGVSENPPVLTLTTVDSVPILSITIFWKEPANLVNSQYQIQTSIF